MNNRDILDELRVRGELVERLERIAPRFREIINLRYGLSFETGLIVRGEMTLEQVAQLYSITTECLRQIEKRAFKELSEGLTDSPWHTGTPTEGGLFLVYLKDGTYDIYEFGKEYEAWHIGFKGVVAWQRIEPYKEKEDVYKG